jgi:hypothetical protein
VARPALGRCVAASLTNGAANGVTFTVSSRRMIPAPAVSVAAVEYRIGATAFMTGQSVPVDLDAILLGSGRAISEITISSFEQPAGAALERRLARAAARRLLAVK